MKVVILIVCLFGSIHSRGLYQKDPDVDTLPLNDIEHQYPTGSERQANNVTPSPVTLTSSVIATMDNFLSSPLMQTILNNQTINAVLSDSMVQGVLRNPTVQSVLNNPIVQSILRNPQIQGITLLQTVLANIPEPSTTPRPSVVMSMVPIRPSPNVQRVRVPPFRPQNPSGSLFGVVLSGIDEILRIVQSQANRIYSTRRN